MYEKTINKYYNNLEYSFITKNEAIILLNNLSKQIKNKDIKDLSERFFETAETIETHLFCFVPICKHIDVVTAIIEYLQNYGAQFMFNPEFDQINEMILLEDSDLYAVINCLMIMDNSCLNTIWIQESIRQKFLKLTEKYLNHFKCPIEILRSQYDLFTFNVPRKSIMSTVSIWSENVVPAKILASLLERDITFINTHMDFNGGVLFVPFAPLTDNLIDLIVMNIIDKTNLHLYDITPPNNAIKMNAEHLTSNPVIYNLFYDGIWQKPVKGIYWKHNNKIFASATNDDIRRCVRSAEEGFKIWRAYTIASKTEVLYKLTKTLTYYRESLLSSLVLKYLQLSYLSENITGYCSGEEKLELIITLKPKGIIILKEENQNTLFSRLIQSLLAGNSVIVIFNANFCNLSQYFHIFSISGIPPGVINMLSCENIIDLESRLCGTQYSIYTKRFFSEGNLIEKYTKIQVQLSLSKQVVHPLK